MRFHRRYGSTSPLTRQARTCYHCRTVYQTSGHATGCEQHHEAEDDIAREATRGARSAGAVR
ncbi:hypothetical protein GCM10027521_11180 [Amycolatopsis cihanbeyliensis]